MKKIYYNGDIITLEDPLYAEAILVDGGRIEEVFYNKIDINNFKDTEIIDLKGKTLMPGFIDAHSHISAFATALGTIDLSSCISMKEIQDRLKESGSSKWIIGFGYDDNLLKEKRHPIKEDLDKVSKDIPILIAHKSGHMGVANSKALEIMGLTKDSIDPEGGKFGRNEKNELTGYLEERAILKASSIIPQPSMEIKVQNYKKAEKIYLSYGITTAQDGLTKKDDFELLKYVSINNMMDIEVVSYIDLINDEKLIENSEYKNYNNNYKISGFKIILDGSPQGKTAWLTKPYENEEHYNGYPIYENEKLKKLVEKAVKYNKQLLIHCNGDAACKQMIDILEQFPKDKLYRPVMIHAQLLQKDQLGKVKQLGIIPSFFIAHTFYFGDTHIKNLGLRAYNISPANSCLKENILFTFHQDTPVIMPNMFETIWCAVNRLTKNNIILGEDEKIPVLEALKAVTINAAYQYGEESKKGSIAVGKKADLIIVDKNPLKIDKEKINEIKVLQTIKKGKVLYKI